MKRVLVTGFEPFGGKKTNLSEQALSDLHDLEAVETTVLPVEFGRAGLEATALAEDGHFDAMLFLGERPSVGSVVGFEQQAHNRAYAAAVPDNAGQRRLFSRIVKDGPRVLPATMDYGPLKAALEEKRIRARFQQKIGHFVCNDLFYNMLYAQTSGDIDPEMQIGFVHLGTNTDVPTVQRATRRVVETLQRDTLNV